MWSLRVAVGALLLIALLIVIVAFQVRRVRLPGEEIVPAGYHRNAAIYVPMRDGAQIGVDIWLPPDLAVGERVPILMCTTRYWRAVQYTWMFHLMVGLHLLDPEMFLYHQGIFFNVSTSRSSLSMHAVVVRVAEIALLNIPRMRLLTWARWQNGRRAKDGPTVA